MFFLVFEQNYNKFYQYVGIVTTTIFKGLGEPGDT